MAIPVSVNAERFFTYSGTGQEVYGFFMPEDRQAIFNIVKKVAEIDIDDFDAEEVPCGNLGLAGNLLERIGWSVNSAYVTARWQNITSAGMEGGTSEVVILSPESTVLTLEKGDKTQIFQIPKTHDLGPGVWSENLYIRIPVELKAEKRKTPGPMFG
ncbi:MAG: hypothetical protein ACP5E4_03925 [Candidatus Aenigmatarchaeota archaeon]